MTAQIKFSKQFKTWYFDIINQSGLVIYTGKNYKSYEEAAHAAIHFLNNY
jgi:hypothetical protein